MKLKKTKEKEMKKTVVILLSILSVASITSANLVLNGDFETGSLSDWNYSPGAAVQSGSVNAGSWAAEVPVNNDIRSVAIDVVAGDSYDFSWAYELTGNTTGDWVGQLRWFSDTAAQNWMGEYTWTTVTDTSWTTFSQTGIVAPAGAQSADVVFRSGTAATGTFRVDDIVVIPEPATFGLFAVFGGAILFLRRMKI